MQNEIMTQSSATGLCDEYESTDAISTSTSNAKIEKTHTLKEVLSTLSAASPEVTPAKTKETAAKKKEKQDMNEVSSDWNLHLQPRAGGIVALTKLQNLEKDAIDGLLQHHSKKSYAHTNLQLTMCKGMPGSKFALAKWVVSSKCKELKLMESLAVLSGSFNMNTNGIVHPYMKFSSVKIPRNECEEYVEANFKNPRGFLVFSSSIGMTKSKINIKDKEMIVLRFSPKAWNKNGHRLSCAHQRKPIIEAVKCNSSCCKGLWNDEEWLNIASKAERKRKSDASPVELCRRSLAGGNVWDSLADLLKIMKLRGLCADDVKEVREIVQHLFTNIVKPARIKRDSRQAKMHVDNLLLQLVDDMLSVWNSDSFLDRAQKLVKKALEKHAKYTTTELDRSRPVKKEAATRRRLGEQVAVNMHTMAQASSER